jgi:hypothetical protein
MGRIKERVFVPSFLPPSPLLFLRGRIKERVFVPSFLPSSPFLRGRK